MSLQIEVFGNIYNDYAVRNVSVPVAAVAHKQVSEIQLRDYQQAAYDCCIRDLASVRSSLIVLATGLGA